MMFLLASALLALSWSAAATSGDIDYNPAMVMLPLGARRQSVVASDVDSSRRRRRRRLFALGEGNTAANFSLPLEGAIKDYG